MKLRKHQAELLKACQDIINGWPLRKIICNVTPGGGKSLLPVIIAHYLIPKIADKLLWIVPRNNLKYQGESEFLGNIIKTDKRLRATNGNDMDPCRGADGYITTYQAIGQNPGLHYDESKNHRYIVFLDEPHHVAKGSSWEAALKPIIDNASLIILASGTLSRNDKKEIAFIDYKFNLPVLKNSEYTRVINYNRSDALKEKAIVSLDFETIDCNAIWEKAGIVNSIESLAKHTSGDAIFTALRTEFAYQMLDHSIKRWEQEKDYFGFSGKLLIVAPNITVAKKYFNYIRNKIYCALATSEDGEAAKTVISNFKKGMYDCLVTVAMAYEGMSVKEITHICALTHIRSVPWLEQLFARANRVIEGKKKAYIIGPKDYYFITAITKISRSYFIATENQDITPDAARKKSEESDLTEEQIRGVRPLSSSATEIEVDTFPISVKESELKNQIRNLRRHIINTSYHGSMKAKITIFNKTIRKIADKKLEDMTINELEKAYVSLNKKFLKN